MDTHTTTWLSRSIFHVGHRPPVFRADVNRSLSRDQSNQTVAVQIAFIVTNWFRRFPVWTAVNFGTECLSTVHIVQHARHCTNCSQRPPWMKMWLALFCQEIAASWCFCFAAMSVWPRNLWKRHSTGLWNWSPGSWVNYSKVFVLEIDSVFSRLCNSC